MSETASQMLVKCGMDYTSFAPGNNSINNSVPPPAPQYSAPEPKHFMNKKFIVIFVILLLLGGGAYAGIWYWQNQQIAQEVVPTFTPRADETADWKTYTNTQYGFEFKYPNYLTAREFGDAIDNEQSDRGVVLQGSDNNTRIQLDIDDTVYVGGAPEKTISSSKVIVGDLEWDKTKGYVYQILPPRTWFIRYLIETSAHSFVFSINKYDDVGADPGTHPIDVTAESQMDQIISTFKFTNVADTSTWKTYTNTQYGFSFKYPSGWQDVTDNAQRQFNGTLINLRSTTLPIKYGGVAPKGVEGKDYVTQGYEVAAGIQNKNSLVMDITNSVPDEMISTKLNISGVVAYRTDDIGGLTSGPVVFIEDPKNSRIYITISNYSMVTPYTNAEKVFDQILSTFKFIQ